jgi:hypothetical protein
MPASASARMAVDTAPTKIKFQPRTFRGRLNTTINKPRSLIHFPLVTTLRLSHQMTSSAGTIEIPRKPTIGHGDR